MLHVIDANYPAHFNLSYFRKYGMKIPENRYRYTLNNNNQHPCRNFSAGKGFLNVF